jgi:predicted nucleic acid-binding protein
MSGVVCDCSVTAAWCLRDETNAAADRILDLAREAELVVPAVWPFEMANVLAAAERRGRIRPADADRALAALARLPLRMAGIDASLPGRLLRVARDSGLSAYDASYLQLALSEGLPLATLDRELAAVGRAAGIEILP